ENTGICVSKLPSVKELQMSNVFRGVLGLNSYKSIICKGSYWERKDGSQWWRNPDTDNIEPYKPGSGAPASKVSPNDIGDDYSATQWEALKYNMSHPSREILKKFDDLTPQEQSN